jgi:hypothetical protein
LTRREGGLEAAALAMDGGGLDAQPGFFFSFFFLSLSSSGLSQIFLFFSSVSSLSP